jgi:hypothetical protein
MATRLPLLRSSKGFYLVSPFLGFFFFMIAMSMTMVVVTENNQQIELAGSSQTPRIVFDMYAVQTDALDVYLQNSLQKALDSYAIGTTPGPIRGDLKEQVTRVMEKNLTETYGLIYKRMFNVTCEAKDTAYSSLSVEFGGLTPDTNVLKSNTGSPFTSEQTSAALAIVSHYYLACRISEPELDVSASFNGRWYLLDASCICCQGCLGASACGLESAPSIPALKRGCQNCNFDPCE